MSRRDHHRLVPQPLRPLSRAAGSTYRELEYVVRNALCRAHPRPLFILGNQKSGTSAVAALLGRRCGLSVSIDLRREIRRPTYHRVPSGELSFARFVRRNRWDFSREIIKEPNLTLLYDRLVEHYPGFAGALVMRDPRDNIRSILNVAGLPGDLPELDEARRAGLRPGWDLVLDARWRGIEGDHYIDQLAARWCFCCDVYTAHRDSLALCRYEDFLADKIAAIDRLAGDLGCVPVADISQSVDLQFQSRGDHSLGWKEFFGENLARIERICGERMAAMGYALEPTCC